MDADDTRRTADSANAELRPQNDGDGEEDDDHELNALLESAFSDFQRQEKSGDTSAAAVAKSEESEKCEETRKETEAEIEQFLKGFADNDSMLKQQWNKIAESCQKAVNATNDEEFEMSLSETLKNLTENAKSLAENTDISDEELSKIWQNVNESAGSGFGAGVENNALFQDMMPLVTNMMQSLLSKDVLHPALKDLVVKYPEWLNENKETLKPEEITRYTRQLELMKVICNEFDAESEADSTEVKSERFQKVLTIMQEMQQCGAPPKDLVAEGPDFGSDGEFDFSKLAGFPSPGGNPSEKCCIM